MALISFLPRDDAVRLPLENDLPKFSPMMEKPRAAISDGKDGDGARPTIVHVASAGR